MGVDAATSSLRSPSTLFSYGFRPFFLLAGVYAMVPTGAVYWALSTGDWPENAVAVYSWHGHEMLFGFAAAAIAGFLLTAVPAWTGSRAVSGLPLTFLVFVWLAARVAESPWMQASDIFRLVPAVAFFPILAVTIAIPLARAKNARNYGFIVLLSILFLADLAVHARRFGWIETESVDGLRLALNLVVLMIVIVGGRIIPAFTRNALLAMQRNAEITDRRAVTIASTIAVGAVLLADLLAPGTVLSACLALLCALLLLVRLSGWGGVRTLDVPLLWVLHLGYFWIVVALVMKAVWILAGSDWAANWMHAFTTGAFGTMILGVMTRVALGHTGRPLRVPVAISVAYVLVSASALIRVFGPWVAETSFTSVLSISIAAWTSAFAIFLIVYIPILLQPRVDGRPG